MTTWMAWFDDVSPDVVELDEPPLVLVQAAADAPAAPDRGSGDEVLALPQSTLSPRPSRDVSRDEAGHGNAYLVEWWRPGVRGPCRAVWLRSLESELPNQRKHWQIGAHRFQGRVGTQEALTPCTSQRTRGVGSEAMATNPLHTDRV